MANPIRETSKLYDTLVTIYMQSVMLIISGT